MEVLDPVAEPERAGVIADDGEDEDGPGEQDSVGDDGAADSWRAEEAECVAGGYGGGQEAGGGEAVIRRGRSENVDRPGAEPEEDERQSDRPAQLFETAPEEAAHEKESRREAAHHERK